MFPALPLRARISAFLIASVSVASLVGIYAFNLQTDRYGSEWATIWGMARFFTILSHVLIVLTFLAATFRREGIGAPWVAALTLTIVLVGAVYHALLRGITEFTGIGYWADIGLHTVVPIAVLLWWLAFAPKGRLRYGDLPMFIMWPCVYVAYALGRGASDGIYPYPFMNVAEIGPLAVATNLAGLLLALLLGGVIFVMIGRFADR
ncbi:Pr6Pr family membrane protein [Gymnodinialimonas hymeniacidonis]|uniref:Pr6Pr family membrane protein n=1 Tax=Gymnodinialimonas hymeniacidonis TaxID=3126508 RepID=UPI0034C5C091